MSTETLRDEIRLMEVLVDKRKIELAAAEAYLEKLRREMSLREREAERPVRLAS